MTNNKLIKNKIKKKDIAIVGSGISGIACAFILSKNYRVTLYESNNYLGGHARTIKTSIVSEDNTKKLFNYDVGFLVYNTRNYPFFTKLLKHLNVKTISSNMSFSVSNKQNSFETF